MICTKQEIIQALQNGEVVGIPTDTVYGLAVLKDSAEMIYELKNRDRAKKLITFIKKPEQIGPVDEFTYEELVTITKKYWPGNNTLIFSQENEDVAYRIPKEINVLNILEDLDDSLLTTSANISGFAPCLTAEEFLKTFPMIKLLEEKQQSIKTNKPSNIYIIKKKGIKKIR